VFQSGAAFRYRAIGILWQLLLHRVSSRDIIHRKILFAFGGALAPDDVVQARGK
jgi:hypothetical protein